MRGEPTKDVQKQSKRPKRNIFVRVNDIENINVINILLGSEPWLGCFSTSAPDTFTNPDS